MQRVTYSVYNSENRNVVLVITCNLRLTFIIHVQVTAFKYPMLNCYVLLEDQGLPEDVVRKKRRKKKENRDVPGDVLE